MKTCNKCNTTKPLLEFRDNRNKCKACERLSSKLYKASHQEEIKITRAKYREENKESISKYYKDKRDSLEDKQQYDKDSYQRNIEANKKRSREWQQRNPERAKENGRLYSQTESGKKARIMGRQNYMNRKNNNSDGTVNKESLAKLLLLQNNKCHHCNKDLDFSTKRAVHLDHYIPLSKGGKHSIDNLVYSCQNCNQVKHAKIPTSLLIIA